MPLYNIKNIISKKPKIGLIFPQLNIAWPYPLFLLVHINLSCNRRCAWCYQLNNEFYSLHNGQMEIDAFKKILCSFKFFKPHIHLYGGEPLLHPDFPSFLEYCQLYGYTPTLTTNGDYLDKYSLVISKTSLGQLNLSVNEIVDDKGNINYDLERKIKYFINTNQKEKIINLNYAIEPNSYMYIEDVVLHFNNNYDEKNFSYFVIQHLSNIISQDEISRADFNLEKLTNILDRLTEKRLKFKLIFLPDIKIRDTKKYYDFKHTFRNRCYIPWLGLSVYPDLMVTPGGGVLGCNFILGNLNESSIRDIWSGISLNNFRSRIFQNGLPVICNRCCNKLYY